MARTLWLVEVLGAALALGTVGCSGEGAPAGASDACFESTFAAIQETVFEAKGCTQSVCHGAAAEGGLDLRADVSHRQLVYARSTIDEGLHRVNPGEPETSVLYRKLQAKVDGTDLGPLGQAMPLNADPLTDDQLEAIRLWIRNGATSDQVMAKAMGLLGCEGSFEAAPNKIEPLPPPEPGTGVQFYSGGWNLPAESEDEVCFVTYYDFTELVPAEAITGCPQFGPQDCFAFEDVELAQDGQSHHSIVDAYTVPSDPKSPEWGSWTCLGGEQNGTPCDPTERDACGSRSHCATEVVTGFTCNRYPHAPALFRGTPGGITSARTQFSGAQESRFVNDLVTGVYQVLPVKGFIAWNSHAFNLTKQDTTIEQWVNLSLAFASDRRWPAQGIFDASNIFAMSPVAPFTKKEICMTFTVPQYTRLMYLSSHMHQRGKLFRIWNPPHQACVGVEGCGVPESEPEYESRIYDDPIYKYYPAGDLPAFDSENEAERTFKACAVFDNGADDASEVKRHSVRPDAFTCDLPQAHCGCEASDRACLGGDDQGIPCGGDDSVCGGGMCDACPLLGGATTDDEMFIPIGGYYVEPPG